MRELRSLNKEWQFIKKDISEIKEENRESLRWERVNVPHTWNNIDGANGYEYHQGACWYKRELRVKPEDEGKKIYIEFMGANSVVDVFVNDSHVGHHRGGFSTFRFDITKEIVFDNNNEITVKVDNTVVSDVYPQKADFTFFGGLYRDVNLVITNDVHIDMLDYGSTGVYVVQEQVSNEEAMLNIKSFIVNDSEENQKVRTWIEIFDAKGQLIISGGKDIFIDAMNKEEVNIPLTVENPKLWNGIENPYLYTVCISLESYNEIIDEVKIETGFRYYEVDADKGFILNGKENRLYGVSRHQDRKDLGWAISKENQEEDMKLIKEVGANTIRLAHYQHDQYFYQLCNQEGMVIWAEIPFISVMSRTELEGINAKQQMIELIRQNFNHPSICFWGIQNEIQIGGNLPEVRKVVKELNQLTKEEDPTRLTTMANLALVKDEDDYNFMTDILGYNKYYGWYGGKTEDFATWLDNYRKVCPDVKLCISEYGAEGILQYHSEEPEVKDYTEEYHSLYHEIAWQIFEKRPFLWATYVWNMFDFGANIRDEGGVKGRNNKGLVTYDRRIRKDAFYMYKAHWSQEPFVHITSKRFIERDQDVITIKVYTNCESVELIVNNKKIDLKENQKIVVFDSVKINKGSNDVKVIAQDQEGNVLYDYARFIGVEQANPSYIAPEAKGESAANWFTIPDLDELGNEREEILITDDVYSIKSVVGDLVANKETKKIITKYLGDVEETPMYHMMEVMSLETLGELDPNNFSEKLLYLFNRDLSKIKKSN